MTRRRISPSIIEEAVARGAAGESYHSIGRDLGIGWKSVSYHCMKAGASPRTTRSKRPSDSTRNEVARLIRAVTPHKEIVALVGCTIHFVKSVAKAEIAANPALAKKYLRNQSPIFRHRGKKRTRWDSPDFDPDAEEGTADLW